MTSVNQLGTRHISLIENSFNFLVALAHHRALNSFIAP